MGLIGDANPIYAANGEAHRWVRTDRKELATSGKA
jgi:hypothetical protein